MENNLHHRMINAPESEETAAAETIPPREELMANAKLIQQTLAQFDVSVSIGDITRDPIRTRYEFYPAPGVNPDKISALSNHIATALETVPIHILTLVPGKQHAVSVEVPTVIRNLSGAGAPDAPPRMICDLADANAFVEEYRKPHVPVMSAFGGGRLHACRFHGSWNLNQMILENADTLFRSIRNFSSKDAKVVAKEWDDLTFQLGPRAFLYADATRLIGYAATSMEAEWLVTQFSQKYRSPMPAASAGGVFYLIQQVGDSIRTKEVSLSPDTVLTPELLALHYGSDSAEWHQGFMARLRERANGLSVLEGRPGTGKTSYLRHLMGELKGSHRFYLIPASAMDILSRPAFIGFWTDERWQHADKRFAVILEDSDAALMTRGSDNREQVNAILNLSDGMLADFLRLQIICTINCSTADIDSALLRPGRLLCHRIFGRLDYVQAARLAKSLGRELPMAGDYSLAEVFAGPHKNDLNRPRIGFAS